MHKLKYKRTIEEGKDKVLYRLYTSCIGDTYLMLAGNKSEHNDWGIYIHTEPIPEINEHYQGFLTFKQAKDKLQEYADKHFCIKCQATLRTDDEANICQSCFDKDEQERYTRIKQEYIKQGYGIKVPRNFDYDLWETLLFPKQKKE